MKPIVPLISVACAEERSPTLAATAIIVKILFDSFIILSLGFVLGSGINNSNARANILGVIATSLLPVACVLKCDFRLFAYKH